jgi:3-phosphoshikimate 1-carboxyvinyltransferase
MVTATATITGSSDLRGALAVPGDKSISHRSLMLSALARGTSTIRGLSDGADVLHTLAAIQALGAVVAAHSEGTARITGGDLRESAAVIDVGNSGTAIRLLAGIAAGLAFRTVLDGDASVRGRPMDRITAPLRLMGADIDGPTGGRLAPLVIRGRPLNGIDYTSPIASAQVKSAILLAGLGATGTTIVREPTASRRHTEEMLAARGAVISVEGTTVCLEPSELTPKDETVPGDPSQAAFWLATAAARPGSEVTVENVYLGPARAGFLDVLRRMGADVVVSVDAGEAPTVRVVGSTLAATDITPDDIPSLVDEIPILAITAALAQGVTRIRGAGELRVKESDRLRTITEMLRGFGVPVVEHEDGLDITGGEPLVAAHIRSHGDHRIAMAAAMAAVTIDGTTTIEGFDSVATSYPTFLDHLELCAPGSVRRA